MGVLALLACHSFIDGQVCSRILYLCSSETPRVADRELTHGWGGLLTLWLGCAKILRVTEILSQKKEGTYHEDISRVFPFVAVLQVVNPLAALVYFEWVTLDFFFSYWQHLKASHNPQGSLPSLSGTSTHRGLHSRLSVFAEPQTSYQTSMLLSRRTPRGVRWWNLQNVG